MDAAISNAVEAYASVSEEEDTPTGHLGGYLKTGAGGVSSDGWTWTINYTKFQSKGKVATGEQMGADGILEMRVQNGEGENRRAILFQAKNSWNDDLNLAGQALRLSHWREAAFVLNYTENCVEAFRLDNVIRSRGKRANAGQPISLSRFLGEEFLRCKVGDLDLHYDARNRRLTWRDMKEQLVSVDFFIGSRIEIKAVAHNTKLRGPKRISPQDLREHRMFATPEDILGIELNATEDQMTAARNRVALTYHPDRVASDDQLLKDISKLRMQEANAAVDARKTK
jgi:hypothetical protein